MTSGRSSRDCSFQCVIFLLVWHLRLLTVKQVHTCVGKTASRKFLIVLTVSCGEAVLLFSPPLRLGPMLPNVPGVRCKSDSLPNMVSAFSETSSTANEKRRSQQQACDWLTEAWAESLSSLHHLHTPLMPQSNTTSWCLSDFYIWMLLGSFSWGQC